MFSEIHDTRSARITDWLQSMNFNIQSFEPASSDASFRRYFRIIHDGGQHIVMDAPPDKENTEPFVRIASILKNSDIHVPEILQLNQSEGFMLLEDFGSHCLLDKLNNDNVDRFYQQAGDCLFDMQSKTAIEGLNLPEYNATLLQRELDIFYQWFIEARLHVNMPTSVSQPLNQLLIDSALQQPKVCVHRDFHSRNLMVLSDGSLGVIDFQDAVIGPLTYDLASLLRDCYIQWPHSKVEHWMSNYYQRLLAADLVTTSLPTFQRWFDLMGLQRHLKAIGIFSRLHLRDQKPGYLADIPRTLNYVETVSQRYSELGEFAQFITNQLKPALENT